MPHDCYEAVKESRYPWKLITTIHYGVLGPVHQVTSSSNDCGFPDTLPLMYNRSILVARIPKKDVVLFILANDMIQQFDYSRVVKWK